MDRIRGVPDHEFISTDLATLQTALISAGEAFTGRTLHPGDPVRLFILWLTDILHQHRINVNETAKQNIPRFAKGKNLDELGALFHDIERLESTGASTTLEFTLSLAQAGAITIPKGTRATPGNQIFFATAQDLQIVAGELIGEVKATCHQNGEIGNGFLPGQISQRVDTLPFQLSVKNTTTSEGGADTEDDNAFYNRMQMAMEEYSTAGSEGAYKAHALKASQLIADVATFSPEPGIADIRILLKNGVIPGQEIIDKVYEALNADEVRPFTDFVQVSSPDVKGFTIDYTYYTFRGGDKSLSEISDSVKEATQKYISWQTSAIGRDINASVLTAHLMETGIKRVEIRQPVFTVLEKIEVAQLKEAPTITDGGWEDE